MPRLRGAAGGERETPRGAGAGQATPAAWTASRMASGRVVTRTVPGGVPCHPGPATKSLSGGRWRGMPASWAGSHVGNRIEINKETKIVFGRERSFKSFMLCQAISD